MHVEEIDRAAPQRPTQLEAAIGREQLEMLPLVVVELPGRLGEAATIDLESWQTSWEAADYEEMADRMGLDKPVTAAAYRSKARKEMSRRVGRS